MAAIFVLFCVVQSVVSFPQLRGLAFLNDDIYEHINWTSLIPANVVIPAAPKPLPIKPNHPLPSPISPHVVFEDKIHALPGVSNQRFGHHIVTNNAFVVVGTSVAGPASKLYVFEEHYGVNETESSGWIQRGTVASPSGRNDGFGTSIVMNNQVLVVGAPQDDLSGFSSGVVYVYSANSNTPFDPKMRPKEVLRASKAQKGANFGQSVAVDGDTLLIGSPGASSESGIDSGLVYVYRSDSAGRWIQSYQLSSEGLGSDHDKFGSAVSIANDTIAVSAVGYSTNVHNGGAVYLFSFQVEADDEHTGGTWTLRTLFAPSDLTAYAYFGHTLTFIRDVGLISAYSSTGSGMVYLYERDATYAWFLRTVLTPSDPDNSVNQFGASLVMYELASGLTVTASPSVSSSVVAVIGAPGDSSAGEMSGAIYVYSAESVNKVKVWDLVGKVTSNDSSSYNMYGQSVAVRGVDLFVGAELADSPVTQTSGVVYVESNLISYYLAVLNDDSEEVHPPSSIVAIMETVRNALVSTVGIILLACVPAAAIALIVVLAVSRGYGGHHYVTATDVDTEGNVLDKDGQVMIKDKNEVAIGPGYTYFVNPLHSHDEFAAVHACEDDVEEGMRVMDHRAMRSDSVDMNMLNILPNPNGFNSQQQQPLTLSSAIVPPIQIPPHPRLTRTATAAGVITLECDGNTTSEVQSGKEQQQQQKQETPRDGGMSMVATGRSLIL